LEISKEKEFESDGGAVYRRENENDGEILVTWTTDGGGNGVHQGSDHLVNVCGSALYLSCYYAYL